MDRTASLVSSTSEASEKDDTFDFKAHKDMDHIIDACDVYIVENLVNIIFRKMVILTLIVVVQDDIKDKVVADLDAKEDIQV